MWGWSGDEFKDFTQVSCIDDVIRCFGRHRLGAEGHTHARRADHGNVVGTVTNGHDLVYADAQL